MNVSVIAFSWGILPGSSCSSSLQLAPLTPSSEPTSPTDSPWHLPTKVSDAGKTNLASGSLSAARFSDIVEDEMTQMQSLRRVTNKSLSLIQVGHRLHHHQLVFIIITIIFLSPSLYHYSHHDIFIVFYYQECNHGSQTPMMFFLFVTLFLLLKSFSSFKARNILLTIKYLDI